MIKKLREDLDKRPELFCFEGPIDSSWLESWLADRHLLIPTDLKTLWCETGGGDIFETESIISPRGRADLGDDIDSVNQFHWAKGMPREYLIFHIGLDGLTCVRLTTGEFVSVSEESYEPQQTFASLADWYEGFIRAEYAARYGLGEI